MLYNHNFLRQETGNNFSFFGSIVFKSFQMTFGHSVWGCAFYQLAKNAILSQRCFILIYIMTNKQGKTIVLPQLSLPF